MRHRHNWVLLFRFALVGASGVVVNLVTLVLVKRLGPDPDEPIVGMPFTDFNVRWYHVYSTIAFLVANLWNFQLNRSWTFRKGHRASPGGASTAVLHGRAARAARRPRAAHAAHARGLAAAPARPSVFDDSTGLRTRLYWAQLIVIAVVTPVSFVLNKLWTFAAVRTRPPRPRRPGPRPEVLGEPADEAARPPVTAPDERVAATRGLSAPAATRLGRRERATSQPSVPPGASPSSAWSGGGQLARMMQGRRSSSGSSCPSSPRSEVASAALVVPSLAGRRPHRPRRPCGTSPRRATSSPSTTSTCRSTSCRPSRTEGVVDAPEPRRPALRPGQARHARAPRRARDRLPTVGPGHDGGRRGATSGRRSAGRSSPRRPGAATTARASSSSPRPRTRTTGSVARRRAGPDVEGGLLLEERVDFVRELAVLVGTQPFRPGRGVARRRDRADRRHLHRGPRSGAGPRSGPRLGRHRGRPAHRRRARRHRRPRRRDVRGATGRRRGRQGGIRRQRARHAAAQQRPLVDGRCRHRAVRAAPPRGARPAARRPAADGPVDRHGQRPRWRLRATCIPPIGTSWPGTPAPRSTSTARECVRVARSATSTSAGRTWPTPASAPRHAADYLQGVITE